MTMLKICCKCGEEKSINEFDATYPNKNNGLLNISYRNKCKKCRYTENQERIEKDPDFYKKQYAAMTEEERKEYIKKKSKMNSVRPDIKEKRKEYNASDIGIFNRYKNDCKRRSRLDRGIEMILSFDQFRKLINAACEYCGKDNCRGVDRVDSDASYTLENTVPCCPDCNEMKNDKTVEEFKKHIEKIYLNIKGNKI
jgi:hypothetical protein